MEHRLQQPRRRGDARLVPWIAATFIAIASAPAPGQSPASLEPAVLAIFQQKCAQCHSPQAKKVEKFGTVLNLAELAANPKLVVPGKPEQSKIWKTIKTDEMPPDDSDIAPLSPAEKETIHRWISLVGPAATAAAGRPATAPSVAEAAAAPRPRLGYFDRLLRWKGKFHPLAAHLPIALIMAATIAETIYLKARQTWLSGAVRFCVALGALGAVGTMGLGWLRAIGYSSSQLLETHRWLGTFAAAWAVLLAILCEWGIRRSGRQVETWHGGPRILFRLALLVGMALIGLSAHMGGSLVHGEDYFTF